jgi:outer membrane receptor for ferrienterochelin and colicin
MRQGAFCLLCRPKNFSAPVKQTCEIGFFYYIAACLCGDEITIVSTFGHPLTDMRNFLASALLLAASFANAQQQDSTELAELLTLSAVTDASELQKKLNENVGAASRKALSSRETPGIVSVITEDDIQRTGARDLVDVLRLVPGFDFGADVSFITGVSLRGAWSLEGKILILLDGHELNELMYQNVAFFNRFPVDLVHRIEIIRGPGSAMYGGTAEYGVINIITKGAVETDALTVSGSIGALPDSYGRRNAQLSLAKKVSDNAVIDVSLFRGRAIRSDQSYQDLYQEYEPVNLTDYTETDTYFATLGLRVNNFQVRGMMEEYQTADPLFTTNFRSFYLTLKNEFKVNPRFSVTPFVTYTRQRPWRQFYTEDREDYFDNIARRIKGGVFGSYDVSKRLNVVVGTEYSQDYAESLMDPEYFDGEKNVTFNMYSFYSQALFRHPFVNITGGFRVDKHNAFGAAFVPRVALTKRFGNFHFKTLASGSYRAPGIDNINLANDIKPERSVVFELEAGYQLTPDMLLSINGFVINTKDIIVFANIDLGGGEFDQLYENSRRFGSRGAEVTYTFRKNKWLLETTYSYYQSGTSTVERYAVPDNDRLFIAFPQHKLGFMAGYSITGALSVNVTANHFSKRYAYTELDEDDIPAVTQLDPYTLINANVRYTNAFIKGLSLSAGVFDLLDERPVTPQAYNGDVAPIPGRSREFTFKVIYTIPLTR